MKSNARIAVVSLPVGNDIADIPGVPVQAVEQMLNELREERPDLALFPQYVVMEEGSDKESRKIECFRSFAKENRTYVVYNALRQSSSGSSSVSVILDRDGEVAGEYVKTHRIDGLDIPLELGGGLPVFALDFGKVALLAGTDIYIPEMSEIYSVLGAELLLVSLGPQALRDDTELLRLLKGRALQNFMYVAASTYASSNRLYMTNNFESVHGHAGEAAVTGDAEASFNAFGLGKHSGRAGIYDLRGETVASTGREAGCALHVIDLDRKRDAASYNYGIGKIVYQQNERGVFRRLLDPADQRIFRTEGAAGSGEGQSSGAVTVGLVHLPYADTIHAKRSDWQLKVLEYVREAATQADLVICSEFSRGDNGKIGEAARLPEYLQALADIARRHRCYIAINDVIEGLNTSLLFSRTGDIIHRYRKVNTLNMMYHSQLPAGTDIDAVELDFGTVGFMICADSYCQEIPRILALQGVELVLLQSQSWGYDAAAINDGASRTWAIENCQFILMSNFPTSQVANRSNLIDPTGETVFATDYDREGVYRFQVDLEAVRSKVSFVLENGKVRKDYRLRERLMAARRPELYALLSPETNPARA